MSVLTECEPPKNEIDQAQWRGRGDVRNIKPQARAPISVIVPIKNEAQNLRKCLPALGWADEVFVVDSQSSDGSIEVARAMGANVVQFEFNGTFPKKKNWALESLPFANEWVLIVDADEIVPEELANEIALRIQADEAEGYYLNMKYFFLGRRIRHCGYAEAWNLRLFKHRLGRYEFMPAAPGSSAGDNKAHEHVELEGRVLKLAHELDHHAYPSLTVWLEKHNRYAEWEAEQFERFLHAPAPETSARASVSNDCSRKSSSGCRCVRWFAFFMHTSSGLASLTACPAWPSARFWHSTTFSAGPSCTNGGSTAPCQSRALAQAQGHWRSIRRA